MTYNSEGLSEAQEARLKAFKDTQTHNHEIMRQVTVLEERMLSAIADDNMDLLTELGEKIDKLQNQYIDY